MTMMTDDEKQQQTAAYLINIDCVGPFVLGKTYRFKL
jgi:hypothetical protein